MNKFATLIFLALTAAGQDSGDVATRGMMNMNFSESRPGGVKKPGTALVPGALVGVTLWRMRPAADSDSPGTRGLFHDVGGLQRELTPERIAANTPLTEGQQVRISIETARAGYLYVVDQDQYADKTSSEPYLIFPSQKLRGGNNQLKAGVPVEIPDLADDPPYFIMRHTRPDQVSELLTILITPKPIPGVASGADRQKLSAAQFASWQKQWASKTRPVDAPDQAGKPYTVQEKNAAAGTKPLGQNDPTPQTMFQMDVKPGAPMLIELPLQIAK